MASAEEHATTVLAGIIPNRRDLLDKAMRQLTPSHFPDRVQQNLFVMLDRYYERTGTVMPLKYLDDLLRTRAEPGQLPLYIETYEMYAEAKVDDSEFAWSIFQLRELAAEKATGEVITEAKDILLNGKTVQGETVRGHEAARSFLLESFSAIDRDLTMQDAPEGDMTAEHTDMLQDYADRKRSRETGASTGILFGIQELDAKTGGMQPGELVIAAGYSSDGKTTLCVQTAWSAAIEQGKNVVFLTTETLRSQVRRKIIARHSMLPQFDLPEGLNTRDLKDGSLTSTEESALVEVIDDLTKNPAYGKLYIAQVPRSSTVSSMEQRLYRIQRSFNIDLVIMDYPALLVPDRRRGTVREELADILKDCKKTAATFDDGRGIVFMAPWQVSRQAREEAEKLGMYTSRALSETAEATNSADLIVSLLAPTDNTSRRAELTMQLLKARDGETANSILVAVDYATSCFLSRQGIGALTTVNNDEAFSAFLN